MKKILVVSPHPDDEVLGCAGAILDHNKNKDKVFWLIMTGIDNSAGWSKSKIIKRESEIKKINKFFKFEKVFNLN